MGKFDWIKFATIIFALIQDLRTHKKAVSAIAERAGAGEEGAGMRTVGGGGEDCWCDVGAGDSKVKEHSAVCLRAREMQEELKRVAPGVGK